jgi:hypothetical protein
MRGNVIPVEITIYEDRSFTFITKTPPAAELIKKAAGLQKGSGVPHKEKVGKLTKDQVREIATTKLPDLNANDIDAAMRSSRAPPLHGRHHQLTFRSNEQVAGPRWPADHTWTPQNGKENQSCSAARPTVRRPRPTTRPRSTPRSPRSRSPRAPARRSSTRPSTSCMRLGVDPRKADQMVRGTVNLPHGTGKTARVLVSRTPRRPTPPVRPAPTSSVATS